MAVKVEVVNTPVIQGREVVPTAFHVVPGIVAAAAYASGDAMGVQFELDTKGIQAGYIVGMLVTDMDKESLGFDLFLFSDLLVTDTADNSAFDPDDGDRDKFRGVVSITAADYFAANDSSFGQVTGLNLPFNKRGGRLIGKCVTRGAPNYTTATDLSLALLILPV